jgi:hypothetical protein
MNVVVAGRVSSLAGGAWEPAVVEDVCAATDPDRRARLDARRAVRRNGIMSVSHANAIPDFGPSDSGARMHKKPGIVPKFSYPPGNLIA